MLFSIVLCSVTSIFFLLNSFILKLKTNLFSEKSLGKNYHKFIVYSEGKQYYSVFKPILDEFETRKIPVMYYTSSEDDNILKEKYEYIQTEFIGKGNKAYFKLAFLNADICLMTTPQLDVLQLKRSKKVKHYCHILHAVGFSMGYRLFSLDYYDSVLCDAKYQIPMIREIEKKRNLPPKKLQVVGCTYMDFNKKRLGEPEPNEKYTILIAPSWGQYSLLNRFGEEILSKLSETDFKVIVRPHPQSLIVDKKLIDNLSKEYEKYSDISWDFSSDNLKAMSKSDVLISDFSSIMMDYAFLFKKPFLYVDTKINFDIYDSSDLDDLPPWRFKTMEIIGRKLNIENGDITNIVDIINQVKSDDKLLENIE
ncbi:CDP-glycerol glycerophosphotransferase family protein, partial [bacterium]|nr:CDP-glycerol glycerophosphotransferase family protein [bacterium]